MNCSLFGTKFIVSDVLTKKMPEEAELKTVVMRCRNTIVPLTIVLCQGSSIFTCITETMCSAWTFLICLSEQFYRLPVMGHILLLCDLGTMKKAGFV